MKDKKRIRLWLFSLVFLAVIGLIVVSCAPAPAPAPTPTPSLTPKPEGTFVWGADIAGTGTFIPWVCTSQDSLRSMAVYDTLSYASSEFESIRGLAERIEYSKDFLTLTIWLRKGIQFQDGWGELTAEDVKYLFEGMGSEGCVSTVKWMFQEDVESMEVVDPYTLVIHQKKPAVDLWSPLFLETYYLPVVCKKYMETVGFDKANLEPIGSGPYRLVEHKIGDYSKFEASEEHWRVVPEFKNLIIQIVPEESTRVAMLKTGQIDATRISETSIPEIPKEGFTTAYWPGGPNTHIVFSGIILPEDKRYKEGYHNQDPWADVRVREAMNIALDRETMNKAIHLDTAKPITICQQLPGWEELEPYPYDPERAKQLLAEAGYPNGFSFDLVYLPSPGVPMLQRETEAAAGYWEQIGLRPKIIPREFPSWFPTLKALENAGTLTTMRYTYTPEPLVNWKCHLPNGTWAVYQDEELVKINERLTATLEMEKRQAIWREIGQHLHDSYATVGLFAVPQIIVSNSQKVGDWPTNWSTNYFNFEYVRHAESLNTFRLFTP
ncbi:ABC transporter substrate-binding protein [Chloroflexota bacterium]